LLEAIKARPIKYLDVDNNKISGDLLSQLLSVLPVEKMHLIRNALTDKQVEPLHKVLTRTPNLRQLFMSHNKLSESSLDLFAAVISVNVQLTDLYFAHNDLDSDAGLKFVANLGNLKKLRRLSLNKCKLNIGLLKVLYESIRDNEDMTELSLYSNEITTEGAEFIAKII